MLFFALQYIIVLEAFNLDGLVFFLEMDSEFLVIALTLGMILTLFGFLVLYTSWVPTEGRRNAIRDKARKNSLTGVYPEHSVAMRALRLDTHAPGDLQINEDTLRSYFDVCDASNPERLRSYVGNWELFKYQYEINICNEARKILLRQNISTEHLLALKDEARMSLQVEKDRLRKKYLPIQQRIDNIDLTLRTVR